MSERIAIDPNIHFGKPCVAGTRIPVSDVLELVAEGIPFDEIVSEDNYPDLEVEDVRACVRYAIEVVTIEELHFHRPEVRLLLDQDVRGITARFLRLGHDVVTVVEAWSARGLRTCSLLPWALEWSNPNVVLIKDLVESSALGRRGACGGQVPGSA